MVRPPNAALAPFTEPQKLHQQTEEGELDASWSCQCVVGKVRLDLMPSAKRNPSELNRATVRTVSRRLAAGQRENIEQCTCARDAVRHP